MKGKKILVSLLMIFMGMIMILLGWLGRTSYEEQVKIESCRSVCADQCPDMPKSILTPFTVFFKYFWVFMMIGTLFIGLAISVVK